MRPTLVGGDRKSQPLVAPRSGKQSYGFGNEVSLESKHIALLKLSDFTSSCLTAELYVSPQPFDPHFFLELQAHSHPLKSESYSASNIEHLED